jgi:hypothetical protein
MVMRMLVIVMMLLITARLTFQGNQAVLLLQRGTVDEILGRELKCA